MPWGRDGPETARVPRARQALGTRTQHQTHCDFRPGKSGDPLPSQEPDRVVFPSHLRARPTAPGERSYPTSRKHLNLPDSPRSGNHRRPEPARYRQQRLPPDHLIIQSAECTRPVGPLPIDRVIRSAKRTPQSGPLALEGQRTGRPKTRPAAPLGPARRRRRGAYEPPPSWASGLWLRCWRAARKRLMRSLSHRFSARSRKVPKLVGRPAVVMATLYTGTLFCV